MSAQSHEQATWLIVVLGGASLLGAIIGLTAYPQAWPAITAVTVLQLAITAVGWRASGRPVAWAVAVAVGCLVTALVHPSLSELVYSGGAPWVGLATAGAALTLYRSAADWTMLTTGSAALVLGSAGLVAVSIRAGVPAAPAIMATSVYLLIGVLAALVLQLRHAREDRVRRPELTVRTEEPAGHPQGSHEAARRALAVVVLRSDELASATEDTATRRTAADLRDVAQRGLTGTDGSGPGVVRIEVHPMQHAAAAPDVSASSAQSRRAPMPDLPDREREILKLLATGASNAAMARSLYLSEATVKQYVSRLMRRFERDNRTQLALLAAGWFGDG